MGESVLLKSVDEAQADMLGQISPLSSEEVALDQALGRVLAQDICADIDVPPFPNSAMDGYAVRGEDLTGAKPNSPVTLAVSVEVAAGTVSSAQVTRGTAIRIMTGAPVPAGADTIVPFEDTDEKQPDSLYGQGKVRIFRFSSPGANIRAAGKDMQRGEVVAATGRLLRPGEIGVLATVGAARLKVFRRPRVAILGTGDELVDVGQQPGPGQIRNSNSYANEAQVLAAGGVPIRLRVARDTEEDFEAVIQQGIEQGADLFLSSGGVSVGDYDVVKRVLMRLGSMEFWRVRMKPGKPIAFGRLHDIPFIGLPGNPVSAMVCFELFARPMILKMQGRPNWSRPIVHALFIDQHKDSADRRQYVRVIVEPNKSAFHARLTGEQGSGLLTSMSKANGLMIIPEGQQLISPGSRMQVMMLDWPEW